MNKKFFLVVGAESTGTHLATNLLIQAGIKRGTRLHDDIKIEDIEERDFPIVYRRSFPHERKWFDIKLTLKPLFEKKLITESDVLVFVCIRNWHCTIKSQIIRTHVDNEEAALQNIKRAYRDIFRQIENVDYEIFSYDEMVNNPYDSINSFYENLKRYGVYAAYECARNITNENKKYYRKGYIYTLRNIETIK